MSEYQVLTRLDRIEKKLDTLLKKSLDEKEIAELTKELKQSSDALDASTKAAKPQ